MLLLSLARHPGYQTTTPGAATKSTVPVPIKAREGNATQSGFYTQIRMPLCGQHGPSPVLVIGASSSRRFLLMHHDAKQNGSGLDNWCYKSVMIHGVFCTRA
jgi:hypothetical protein